MNFALLFFSCVTGSFFLFATFLLLVMVGISRARSNAGHGECLMSSFESNLEWAPQGYWADWCHRIDSSYRIGLGIDLGLSAAENDALFPVDARTAGKIDSWVLRHYLRGFCLSKTRQLVSLARTESPVVVCLATSSPFIRNWPPLAARKPPSFEVNTSGLIR